MQPEDIYNTDEDAYKMAVSVALHTLSDIMEHEASNYRIWAAEAVLENQPANKQKAKENK